MTKWKGIQLVPRHIIGQSTTSVDVLHSTSTFRISSRSDLEDWPSQATNENLPPNVIKQLAKELKNLDETPPEGIKVGVNDDNFSIIYADIEGPAGTPYDHGVFRMKLILSHDFPQLPPKGYFLTKIFHPNIANNGEICVNALKRDWSPSLGLRHVLMVIRCLLIEPFPESALNEQAGKMLLDDYEEYARYARLYTGLHAKAKSKLKVGVISVCNAEQKTAEHGVTSLQQSPSPLAPSSNAMKGGKSVEQPVLTSRTLEMVDGASAATPLTYKKEIDIPKVQADKKKMDARKKSLKRL